MTKLEVIDSALKIGLGSLITAVSGYIILLLTQKHEIAKEEKTTAYKLNEHKKWLCKRTRFSSTHFLRFPGFQPSAGILPASGYSGIRGGARRYIQPASAL